MKTIQLITSFIFLFLISCQHDNVQTNFPQTGTLQGNWKLVNVSGGFAGVDDTFPEGLITWKINTISQTVIVTNNNTDNQKQDILPSGTYHYNIISNTTAPELCLQTIVINDINMGCFSITATQFLMSQIESDGFAVKLIR